MLISDVKSRVKKQPYILIGRGMQNFNKLPDINLHLQNCKEGLIF